MMSWGSALALPDGGPVPAAEARRGPGCGGGGSGSSGLPGTRYSAPPGTRYSATQPEWPAGLLPRSAFRPPRAGQEPGPFLPGQAARAQLPKIPHPRSS